MQTETWKEWNKKKKNDAEAHKMDFELKHNIAEHDNLLNGLS